MRKEDDKNFNVKNDVRGRGAEKVNNDFKDSAKSKESNDPEMAGPKKPLNRTSYCCLIAIPIII